MKLDLLNRQWLEIVFEGRNKSYGAYTLRKENSKTLVRALIIGALLFTVAIAAPVIADIIGNASNDDDADLNKKIVTIKHIVVASEQDALLLENNLIKKLQPRYNVLLRDDKTYPWICIKKEPFSRIFPTRRMIKDGSEYYGPYTNFKTVNTILEMINALYPLRTCNYDLSQTNIDSGKYKVCLEFHIGNCKGGCEGYELAENYQKQVNTIREILKGNFKESIKEFKIKMQQLAQDMHYEEAQKIKDKLEVLQNYQSRSTILNPKISKIKPQILWILLYIFSLLNPISLPSNYLSVIKPVMNFI
jgi:hypothetical protein